MSESQFLDSLGGVVFVEEHLLSVLEFHGDVGRVLDHVQDHVNAFLELGLFQLVEVEPKLSFEEIEAVVNGDAEILLLSDFKLGRRGHDYVPLFVRGGAVPN